MAHPLIWPGKTSFSPISNAPASSLAQDSAFSETSNILLLGCGDPSRIIYTAYATQSTIYTDWKLDITCCDIESAILARNVLLFTMLADDGALERLNQIWDIFYHFYLDDSSFSLLLAQCAKLIKLSEDLATWNGCQYASFLRMCTDHTLMELRRYWTLYAETGQFPQKKRRSFKKKFAAGIHSVRGDTITMNARGPGHGAESASKHVERVFTAQFNRFWVSGSTSQDSKSATHVNPTFVYSSLGDKFAVYGGTDPLSSFHLTRFVSSSESITVEDTVSTARMQFCQWCTAFARLARNSSVSSPIIIRFFAGDAIAFCDALRNFRLRRHTVTAVYTAPWSGSWINLNSTDYHSEVASPAPTAFDIIDSSTIIDHLGLWNVLFATYPLLNSGPSATIYTKTASSGRYQHTTPNALMTALLIGLRPSTFQGIVSPDGVNSPNRLAWKMTSEGGPHSTWHSIIISRSIAFSPQELAKLLFEIYLYMFANESQSSHTFQQDNILAHHIRQTFAVFVRLVQDKVHGDWREVMETFYGLIGRDESLPLGKINFQDLCCQFYLLGVHTPSWFSTIPTWRPHEGIFHEWDAIPSVACVVLVIPRQCINYIATELDEVGTPDLFCRLGVSESFNAFSSIHAVFGTLRVVGQEGSKYADITPDSTGRLGSSPLIVSFWVPSSSLLLEPWDLQVSLLAHCSPITSVFSITPKLGSDLLIFSAGLLDQQHVHVLAERPSLNGRVGISHTEESRWRACPSFPRLSQNLELAIDNSDYRQTIWDPFKISERSSLADVADVTFEQVSPYSLQLHLRDYTQLVDFPVPIAIEKTILSIGQCTGSIRVIARPGHTLTYESSKDEWNPSHPTTKHKALLDWLSPLLLLVNLTFSVYFCCRLVHGFLSLLIRCTEFIQILVLLPERMLIFSFSALLYVMKNLVMLLLVLLSSIFSFIFWFLNPFSV